MYFLKEVFGTFIAIVVVFLAFAITMTTLFGWIGIIWVAVKCGVFPAIMAGLLWMLSLAISATLQSRPIKRLTR